MAEVALEAKALRNPKGRDDAAFDWLAALSGSLACGSKFPPRPVSRRVVPLPPLPFESRPEVALSASDIEKFDAHEIKSCASMCYILCDFKTPSGDLREF